MDIKSAQKLVMMGFPKYSISKSYSGKIGSEEVFGFIINKGISGKFIVVYTDGTVTETTGLMAESMMKSLKEV